MHSFTSVVYRRVEREESRTKPTRIVSVWAGGQSNHEWTPIDTNSKDKTFPLKLAVFEI